MTNNKINFTNTIINNLVLPASDKRNCYYDIQTSGLGIMVFPSGTKTFFLYKRVNGRPDKIKLGKFPEMSIEQARKSADSVMNEIFSGKDPNKDKQKLRKESTLQELYDIYMENHAKVRKITWKDDESVYRNHLKDWEKKPLSLVSKSLLVKKINDINHANGLYAANHSLVLLKTMFNKAIEWGWEGVNPCFGIKKFKEKTRERFLGSDEIPSFFSALNQEPNETFRDFFTFVY